MVDLGKVSLLKGGSPRPPPTKRPGRGGGVLCGGCGFPNVKHRKLLGFPKGPGAPGPGTQKLLHGNDPGFPGPDWDSQESLA